ncbi:MAG: xanthine dehydrogenase family protein molybdopterin-binding subunit [Chloroflexota bacterium]|nr:xanthine dehydrogenase family protein molybdopterin-binding subunit [Chloroflexota bacterium]
MVAHAVVGERTKRIDAPQKLTGQERFTGDLKLPGLAYARPVGSAYAHARITGVKKDAALAVPGVIAVLTVDDLPLVRDENGVPAKTPIAREESLHAGQTIAIVVAESPAAAEDGAALVEIDYDPRSALVTLDDAIAEDAPTISESEQLGNDEEAGMHNADAAQEAEEEEEALPPNVSNSVHFHRGNIDAGFAEADAVVDLTFDSLTVHQGYLEPQSCLVAIEPLGDLTVYTSTQAAFHCRNRVSEALGLPVHRVNVVPMPVGGGFGGKFVLIEPLVAAVAVALERPVLMQYTRMEDFVAGNPAPDSRIQLKVGAKRDGTITALQSRIIFDTGASPGSPLQICAVLMGGYYRFPNLEIRGYEVLSHKPGAGAYRAPGAQAASFAIESVIDELARKLGIDPIELRLKNCVVEGDERPNGATWPTIGLKESLVALRDHPAWANRAEAQAAGRGVGIGVGGWPGGVEPATAVCRLDSDGSLTVVLGSVDLSGTNTTFAQIAAEAFNVDADEIQITTASTDAAPYAGGTGGSKITYTVGPAVQQAAAEARRQILDIAAQHLEAAAEDLEIADGMVRVKGVPGSGVSLRQIGTMTMSFGAKYEPVFGRGSTAITESAPGFAVHLAEVDVDEMTGETKVTRYVAVQDVGFAINPAAVEGQIHGGVAQGLGWALYEGMAYDSEGQLQTASLMDYVLPTAAMIPPIETVFVEIPSKHGAYGSKGIGEPPAIPGPAVIANAIRDAVGVRMTEMPIKPQALAAKMWGANDHV